MAHFKAQLRITGMDAATPQEAADRFGTMVSCMQSFVITVTDEAGKVHFFEMTKTLDGKYDADLLPFETA